MTTTTDETARSAAVATEAEFLSAVLDAGSVRSVFQPIVDLDTGEVPAFEALSRGPQGPLETPMALFGVAGRTGRLTELDVACRTSAFRTAARVGISAPTTLFVNVEPQVLDGELLGDLTGLAESAPTGLSVVIEITERALAARPAELLRTVERVRELGWGVALDDVGAEPASLTFMSLLCPDVVKLDLSLVQGQPSRSVAEVMNAVNSYAEWSGALILAEGIETEQHLAVARSLGATLGQGWLFGRPSERPHVEPPSAPLRLLAPASGATPTSEDSPFGALPAGTVLRTSPKRLLVELSHQLEREARRIGESAMVAATFQEAEHFTAATARRYRDLVETTGFVCALGRGLPDAPLPGLRGAAISAADPLCNEWDVTVLSPHFSGALLARDLGDPGPDLDRMFEYALTYDRDTVVRAARGLLSRVVPATVRPAAASPTPGPPPGDSRRAPVVATDPLEAVLDVDLAHRALSSLAGGVTVADMTDPAQPLVWVNEAFERLTGIPRDLLTGRNCRQLQGPETDPGALTRIRAAIAAGQEVREVLLNVRGDTGRPWWNELHLSPVRNDRGEVVRYIGVQNDVTDRVEAQRALAEESERSRRYLEMIEELAFTDPLTSLANRRAIEDRVDAALLEADVTGTALAYLYLDLDHFKAVNDGWGHAAGDDLLRVVGRRIKERLRAGDLVARLGGDEFLVVATGLTRERARLDAEVLRRQVADALAHPVVVADTQMHVSASIGVSVFPDDAGTFGELLHAADLRMYDAKQRARRSLSPTGDAQEVGL